jgi:uncharacterized protein YdcH (DUF465 family)
MVNTTIGQRPALQRQRSKGKFPSTNTRHRRHVMLGEMHDIMHEFPNLEELISDLHEQNAEFAQMMDEHDQLDSKIRDLEVHDQPTSDFRMEDLKKQRALLKDRIYEILRHTNQT